MSDPIYKRCKCRDEETGRDVGANCPKLRRAASRIQLRVVPGADHTNVLLARIAVAHHTAKSHVPLLGSVTVYIAGRRFMALETEVHRVKRRLKKRATETRVTDQPRERKGEKTG